MKFNKKFTEVPQSSVSKHPFLMFPFFKNIWTPRLEPTKCLTVFFTTLVLQGYPQGYILSYFYRFLRVLSPSRILAEFSATLCGKNLLSMMFVVLENALNLGIFPHGPVSHSKLQAISFQSLFPKRWRKLWFSLSKFN